MTRLTLFGLLMMLWLACLALRPIASTFVVAQQQSASRSSSTSDDFDEVSRLHQQAVKLYEEGRYDEAIPLAVRALAIGEKLFKADSSSMATLLGNLALIYKSKGDYESAEPLYLRALAIREKTLGPEHPETAKSLSNLAGLYLNKGDYQRAEPMYLRALAIEESIFGKERPETASSLGNLANLYFAKGDYGRAEPLLRRVVAIFEKTLGTEHPLTAQSLNNLAALFEIKNDYGQAERLYERALAIREKTLGAEHQQTASSLHNLAGLYVAKGDYERAEPLYQRAVTIFEKVLGREHPLTATSLTNLAGVYFRNGDDQGAEPLYLRALAIREKALGKEHPDTAGSLVNLANLYYRKGDYERSEPIYQRALTIFEKILGTEHPTTATGLSNLATVYRNKGDYQRSEPLYLRALAIWEKAFGAKHREVAKLLINLAALCWIKGDYQRAEILHERAAEIQEQHLTNILLGGSDQQKQLYLNTLSGETSALISFNARVAPTSVRAARLASTVILQRKGRALDAITEQISLLRRRANPHDRQLLDQLFDTRTQLATLEVNETSRLSPEQRRAQVAQLEADAEKLERAIGSRSAEFAAEIQPITLAGVQQAIPPDAALIEFVVYQPFNVTKAERLGNPRYVAYAFKREGIPKFVDLGEAEIIDRRVMEWRKVLVPEKDENKRLIFKDDKPLARELDELVMRPVRGLVGETRRLLISPDGALNLIPFAALVNEKNEYLVKNYTISYLTSGRDLLRLQVARENKQAPLVIANPDFDAKAGEVEASDRRLKPVSAPASTTSANAQSSATSASGLARLIATPLPATAEEAQAIKALLPEAIVLTDRQATETAIKRASAPRLLHIATHGFFLEDLTPASPATRLLLPQKNSAMPLPSASSGNPLLLSGLALAGFNLHRSGDDDGVLMALEATGLNLWGTQMVVLSACDTGVGTIKNGQGVYGLRRALVLAGAETQVISLWPVSNLGTRDLMIEYYKALLQAGQGRSEGLRHVQLKLLTDTKRQHPYYWASFIQSGEWANLDGKR